ncbi:MAG: hypothetical protein NZ553_01960 [Caldilinea sp.]|nr:hypothetical protein [Caldilinea sp.]MDW8439216.1 hypothetical protein [Caldilineaceae bacterium]
MQDIWIAFFIGLMLGWIIEWLIDWRFWRPHMTALRQENEQLRRQLEQFKANPPTTQKQPAPSSREKIYN